jgi:circadian clock protein KaiC
MYFSFEESPAQILRNMRSVGINLQPHVAHGLLEVHSSRPTIHGLEMHLARMHKMIEQFKPAVVIVDPLTNLQNAGTLEDSTNMLVRLIDFLREKQITGFFVGLTSPGKSAETTDQGLSSMVDTWLLLRDIEVGGERNRAIYVLKSRGMAHSNQVREFLITSKGIKLVKAYLGPSGVLTGSARLSQEAKEAAEEQIAREELARKKLALDHRRKAIEAQIAALQVEFKAEEEEFKRVFEGHQIRNQQIEADRLAMARNRQRGRKG